MKIDNNIKESLDLLNKIAKLDELHKESVLEVKEDIELYNKIQAHLDSSIPKSNLLWRKYDKEKRITLWRDTYSEKYLKQTQQPSFNRWKPFLKQFIELNGKKQQSAQQVIDKGDFYSGRRLVKTVINEAKSHIDIQDGYIDESILEILEPTLKKTPAIKIRILTNKKSKILNSEIVLFNKQFQDAIKLKIHKEKNCHDRFIIIDGKESHTFGQSFKDIGNKFSLYGKIKSKDPNRKIIESFNEWWNKSN